MQDTRTEWRLGHRPALDGIRAFAILGVLFHHASFPYLEGGHVGVTVFFTLSGFLITVLLLEESDRAGTIDLAAFYARRAARLLPGLVVALSVGAIVALLLYGKGGVPAILWGAAPAMLYIANLTAMWNPDVEHVQLFGWAWSLSLEEQFYLVWPGIVLLALRSAHRRKVLAGVCVAVIAVAVVVRATLGMNGGWNPHLYLGPDSRMDALAAGCLLGLWVKRRGERSDWVVSPALGGLAGMAGIVAILAVYNQGAYERDWTYHCGLPLVTLGSVGVILSSLGERQGLVARVLASRPLRHIGRISYGLYLWNLVVWIPLNAAMPSPSLWVKASWLAGCCLIAELSWRYVEQPTINRVSAKLRARRDLPTADPSAAGRTKSRRSENLA